jgi:hypothetical protein
LRLGAWRLTLRLTLPRSGSGRSAAHDRGLDDEVGRAADEDQMLDIVAPDEDQLAPAVDRERIDERQPRHAPARGTGEADAAEALDQPVEKADQDKNRDERYDELRHDGTAFAEYRFQHFAHTASPGRAIPDFAVD